MGPCTSCRQEVTSQTKPLFNHSQSINNVTTKYEKLGCSSDLNSFHSLPSQNPAALLWIVVHPVDAVAGFLDMHCDAVLGVTSSYCLPMFTA